MVSCRFSLRSIHSIWWGIHIYMYIYIYIQKRFQYLFYPHDIPISEARGHDRSLADEATWLNHGRRFGKDSVDILCKWRFIAGEIIYNVVDVPACHVWWHKGGWSERGFFWMVTLWLMMIPSLMIITLSTMVNDGSHSDNPLVELEWLMMIIMINNG